MTIQSAIVLAAGEGRRLRPLTHHRPKPMLPAGTKPILEHVFDQLIDAGITDITVVVGYGRTAVQSYFGPTYRDVSLEYVAQEKQLGSAHALAAAAPVDEPTLVVNGDQIVESSIISETISQHSNDHDATLATLPSSDVRAYGGVIFERNGTVTEIVENPSDDREYRLNAGVYALEPSALEVLTGVEPQAGEYSLVDGLLTLLERGHEIQAVSASGMWLDATYPWDLLEIADTLFENGMIETQISSAAHVHETATIIDPVVIEPDCVIGPGAVVGPNVCLRENATVGANGVLERSVIDMDTRIGANATVLDCVAGRGVNLGAGSAVVGGPGDVHVGETIHREEPLGAVIADRTHDAGGVTYAPGTVVGADVRIGAGRTLRGSIEPDTEVH